MIDKETNFFEKSSDIISFKLIKKNHELINFY